MSTTAFSVLGTIRMALEKFNESWDSFGPARVKPMPKSDDGKLIVDCDSNQYEVIAEKRKVDYMDKTLKNAKYFVEYGALQERTESGPIRVLECTTSALDAVKIDEAFARKIADALNAVDMKKVAENG